MITVVNRQKKAGVSTQQAAFTIVELLIVIVVIGILAAITIIAFNGVQEKARIASTQSATEQASKKLAVYQVTNGSYPTQLSDAGVSDSSNTTFQYSVNNDANPATYCVTATTGSTSYYINNTDHTSPTSGGCPGDGVGGVAAITNLVPNPSFETDISAWSGYYSPTRSQSSVQAKCGQYSQKIVTTSTSQINGTYLNIAKNYSPGEMLGVSLWVWAPTGMTLQFGVRGASTGLGGGGMSPQTVYGTNSWQQVSVSFTVPNPADTSYGPVVTDSTKVSGDVFYIDCAMLVDGDLPHSYTDPNTTSSWKWNGEPNLSTSTGPPGQ